MNYRSNYLGGRTTNIGQNYLINDSKDLLINKLKDEILDLKQNQRDFKDLSQQLKELEFRYENLNSEKIRTEQELKMV